MEIESKVAAWLNLKIELNTALTNKQKDML